MMQPTMKKQIVTAKTMASDKIMMDSVRLVDEPDVFQPAGRTESSWSDCMVVVVSTARTEDVEQHWKNTSSKSFDNDGGKN